MYKAKVLEQSEFSPGGWKGLKVGVYKVDGDREEQIGQYERNYGSLFNTFFHFHQNGKDLALYSPSYTVTRIMELPSCKDIGGEEPAQDGFCPVDYFVPTYLEQEDIFDYQGDDEKITKGIINNPHEKYLKERIETTKWNDQKTGEEKEIRFLSRPLTPVLYHPFGFIAGCIWGDDSSWKIQYLDLAEAYKGIVKRDERFGYIALPENQSLKEAVDMYDYGYDWEDEVANYIRLNVTQTFDLRTGKIIHPFN